jgi:hypothetical protein
VLLVVAGGDRVGMPNEWLARAFPSWAWPGLILGVIVGGTQLVALIAQRRRYVLAWGLHAASGLVMMIWIFVEIALLLVWSPLHGVYFLTGLVQTVLAVLALSVRGRSPCSRGCRDDRAREWKRPTRQADTLA